MDALIPNRVKYIALALLGLAAIGGAFLLGEDSGSTDPAPVATDAAPAVAAPKPTSTPTLDALPEDEEPAIDSAPPKPDASPSASGTPGSEAGDEGADS